MKSPHITTKFYLSLLEFLLSSKQQLISIGAEFGLTAMQTVTLLLLDEDNPRPMKSYCQLYHCDPGNLTGIIDGLEERTLVERRNNPKDRRVKILCLTPTGKRMQVDIIERLHADNDFLFAPLTADETKQFVHIIEKLSASKHLN